MATASSSGSGSRKTGGIEVVGDAMLSPGHGVVRAGPHGVVEPPLPKILVYGQEIRSEVETRFGPRSQALAGNPIVSIVRRHKQL